MQTVSQVPGVAGRLRIADVNQDGYPDFVITLAFKDYTESENIKEFTRSVMLLNDDSEASDSRSFSQVKTDSDNYFAKVLQYAGDTADFLTFMDIDDDGKLDFVLQKTENGLSSVLVLYNNVVSDNFFIKALSVNSELKKSQNIYNDYSIGPTYRFVVTDMQDNRLVNVGSQRFQSGYMSLQLPFAFLGVGRSNNYVEMFYAAQSINGKRAEKMWTPIIPNSQLIIFMF